MKLFHKNYFDSQIGTIEITCDHETIIALTVVEKNNLNQNSENDCTLCQNAALQLKSYFDGFRTEFDLPLKLNGSPMQNNVWNFLKQIPYGKTVSYSEVALAAQCNSIRAVATAIGKNPIPIIIPCHRVIRKSGAIGEFSLGGPQVKEFLLHLEKCI